MTVSPKYALTYLEVSQAQKHVGVNEGFRRIEALTQILVKDRDLTTPPGSPANLDTYIPKATATGDWTGAENDIAFYDLDEWTIVPPSNGMRVYIDDENIWLYWTGSTWAALPGATMTGRVYGDAALDNTVTRVQTFGPGVTAANTGGSEATYEIGGGLPVITDMSLTTPPGSPVVDAMYIPLATATGAWAGQEDDIARWYDDTVDSGWEFYTPYAGQRIHDLDTGLDFQWTGSAWTVFTLDSNFEQVKLLLSLDGADLATTATDDSDGNHTITFIDGANLVTANKKFGTASCDFDGTTDNLEIASHTDHDFGIYDFTVEFWTRQTAEPSGNIAYISKYDTTGNERQWTVQYDPTSNRIVGFHSTNGTDFSETYFDMDTDGISVAQFFNSTFHHIAYVRYRNLFLIFVDGKPGSQGQIYENALNSNPTIDLIIGARRLGAGVELEMTGQIDEVRITKGRARYTAPFTPPTQSFPRV